MKPIADSRLKWVWCPTIMQQHILYDRTSHYKFHAVVGLCSSLDFYLYFAHRHCDCIFYSVPHVSHSVIRTVSRKYSATSTTYYYLLHPGSRGGRGALYFTGYTSYMLYPGSRGGRGRVGDRADRDERGARCGAWEHQSSAWWTAPGYLSTYTLYLILCTSSYPVHPSSFIFCPSCVLPCCVLATSLNW